MIEVTLRFENELQKDDFFGQLMDGWGESYVHVGWDWQRGLKFEDATTFDIEVYKDETND